MNNRISGGHVAAELETRTHGVMTDAKGNWSFDEATGELTFTEQPHRDRQGVGERV